MADRRDRLGPRDRTRLSFFASWSSLLAFSSRLALVAASSSRGRERRASIGAGEARSRAASRPSRSGFPSPEKRAIGQRQPKSSLSISRQIFDAMARGGSARQAWTARSHALVVLCLMVLVVGLLIAPSARRRIVEQREGTTSINRGRGGAVKSRKQAIAIGLSEPRKKGNRSASTKKQPEHFKADFRCDGTVADRCDRLGPRDRTRHRSLAMVEAGAPNQRQLANMTSVVVGISHTADRRLDAGLGEPLAVFDRDVLTGRRA